MENDIAKTCRYLERFGLDKQILFRLLDTGIRMINPVQTSNCLLLYVIRGLFFIKIWIFYITITIFFTT